MQPDQDSQWPAGLAGYDRIMARRDQQRGFDPGERTAIEPYIAADEPIVGRHFAVDVTVGESSQVLHRQAVLLSTDRKLVMVTAKGTFRRKFDVHTFDYANLKPGVGKSDSELYGSPLWFAGFGTQSGTTYVLRFFNESERDEFVSDVGGAVGGWHIIHGNA